MYLLPSWIGSKLASCSGLDFMTFFEQRLQQNARSQVTSVTKMSRSINGWRNTCRFAALCNSFLRLSFETPNPTKRANNSPLNYFCWLFIMFIYALGCKSVHGSSYFLTKGLDRFALTNLVQCAGALAMEFIQTTIGKTKASIKRPTLTGSDDQASKWAKDAKGQGLKNVGKLRDDRWYYVGCFWLPA